MEDKELDWKKRRVVDEKSAILIDELENIESELRKVQIRILWARRSLTEVYWRTPEGEIESETISKDIIEIDSEIYKNLTAQEEKLRHERQQISIKLRDIYNECNP